MWQQDASLCKTLVKYLISLGDDKKPLQHLRCQLVSIDSKYITDVFRCHQTMEMATAAQVSGR